MCVRACVRAVFFWLFSALPRVVGQVLLAAARHATEPGQKARRPGQPFVAQQGAGEREAGGQGAGPAPGELPDHRR